MRLKSILMGFALSMLITAPAFAEKKISVLPFEVLTQKEDMKQFGVGTMDTLTNALSNVPEFIMIDRGQLNQLIKEQAFQKSGFSDSKETIELGKIVGADILVFGSIQYFDNEYRISSHFTDVKTGKILKTVLVTGSNIFKLQDQLASELIKQQDVKITTQQQEAIKNITQATDNTLAYDYYIKGRNEYLHTDIKGYKAAIEYYNKALEIDKDYVLAISAKAEAQVRLANDYNMSGIEYKDLLNQAEENAKIAVSLNDTLSETHRALSLIYSIKLDFQQSKIEAEKALKINPNDAETYAIMWFINSYADNKFNLDPDNKYLRKSMELNPNLITSHIYLSLSYLKNNDFINSNKEAEKIVALNPNNMYGHYILGNNYVALKRKEDAVRELNIALELNPDNTMALTGIGTLYLSENKYDEAIMKLKKAIEISSINYGAHFVLSLTYLATDKIDDAEREIKTAITIFPGFLNYSSTHNTLSKIALERGKTDEAIAELNKALELDPSNQTAHYSLGIIYQQQNKFEQAISEFKKVNNFFNHSAKIKLTDSYINLGNNFYNQGKFSEAISTYKDASKENPDNADIHINLGVAYFNNKQLDEAISQYLQAIKINPQLANAHYNLGIVYQTQGKMDMAKDEYKKSCELGLKSGCQ